MRSYLLPAGATGAMIVVGEGLRISLDSGRTGVLLFLLLVQLLVGIAAIGLSGVRLNTDRPGLLSFLVQTLFVVVLSLIGVAILSAFAQGAGLAATQRELPEVHPALMLTILSVGALAEELVFRGAVLFGRTGVWGPNVALAISTVAFAAVHIPSGALVAISSLFTGWLWGTVALRRNSIALSLAAHLIWNWIMFAAWLLT